MVRWVFLRPEGRIVDVLVAARDIRVRRALSGLVELAGSRIVGATHAACLVPDLDVQLAPDLVVLEMDRRDVPHGLQIVERLTRRGRCLIVVCSGPTQCTAVLAAGARTCLDRDDPTFADRLAEAVQAVTGPSDRRLQQE